MLFLPPRCATSASVPPTHFIITCSSTHFNLTLVLFPSCPLLSGLLDSHSRPTQHTHMIKLSRVVILGLPSCDWTSRWVFVPCVSFRWHSYLQLTLCSLLQDPEYQCSCQDSSWSLRSLSPWTVIHVVVGEVICPHLLYGAVKKCFLFIFQLAWSFAWKTSVYVLHHWSAGQSAPCF